MSDVDSVEAVYYQARLDYATEILELLSECNNKEIAVILKKDIARAERKLGGNNE